MDMQIDGWKRDRIESDRRKLVAMNDADRRIAALELSLRYEAEAHAETRVRLAALQTPAVPFGWHSLDASLCGVEFAVHFKVDFGRDCSEWRIYPAGTSADISHAINSSSQLYQHLDDEVTLAIERMDDDEAENVATASVLSLREAQEVSA